MVYVHVPFCGSFCTYCGFYSETMASAGNCIGPYCRALEGEIRLRKDEILGADSPDTLYIGGGTPSVLPPDCIGSIAEALYAVRGRAGYEEFTVEVNPEDIVEKGLPYVRALAAAGVDRISMGVQSLDDNVLKWMNRRHDAATARQAYRILREAGISNISLDLIFGISSMPDRIWLSSLKEAADGLGTGVPPEHISAYQLSVEPGSVLGQLVSSGKYAEASDVCCSRQYDMLCGFLAEAGYRHYEISNFALPGHEARHNSGYWTHSPYVGLGPAAHSFSLSGRRRSWNVSSLSGYLSASSERPDLLPDGAPVFSGGHEILTDRQLAMEKIMLGLRTDTGVDEGYLRENTGAGAVDRALESGSLCRSRSCLRIPEVRFFVSDNIIAELF